MVDSKDIYVTNPNGEKLFRFETDRNCVANIDVLKMIENLGVKFDKNVEINIIK